MTRIAMLVKDPGLEERSGMRLTMMMKTARAAEDTKRRRMTMRMSLSQDGLHSWPAPQWGLMRTSSWPRTEAQWGLQWSSCQGEAGPWRGPPAPSSQSSWPASVSFLSWVTIRCETLPCYFDASSSKLWLLFVKLVYSIKWSLCRTSLSPPLVNSPPPSRHSYSYRTPPQTIIRLRREQNQEFHSETKELCQWWRQFSNFVIISSAAAFSTKRGSYL